jgi:hypothetical protein
MTPEANLWQQLKKNLPSNTIATRVENRNGGGIPDVHMLWDSLPFWMELKTTKNNSVKISPHQIAWNYSYSLKGGLNFFLVKSLSSKNLFLFRGDQGARLLEKGLCDLAPFYTLRLCDFASFFVALRPIVVCHYKKKLEKENPGASTGAKEVTG